MNALVGGCWVIFYVAVFTPLALSRLKRLVFRMKTFKSHFNNSRRENLQDISIVHGVKISRREILQDISIKHCDQILQDISIIHGVKYLHFIQYQRTCRGPWVYSCLDCLVFISNDLQIIAVKIFIHNNSLRICDGVMRFFLL